MVIKAAVFDLDGTLLNFHSGRSWFDHERSRGRASYGAVFVAMQGRSITEALEHVAMRAYRGVDVRELEAQAEAFVHEVLLPRLRPDVLAVIESHRVAGRRIALGTATLDAIADPVCEALGLERAAATVLARTKGGEFYSGRVSHHGYCEGKLQQVKCWASAGSLELSEIVFYSDSYSDRPLLEAVGRPVCVCPDAKLRVHAEGNSWEIRNWSLTSNQI